MRRNMFPNLSIMNRNRAETRQQEEEEEKASDELALNKMGYKQELRRGFSSFMSFSFCFTAVNVLTSISIGFTYTLTSGGSGIAIWSWIIGSVFTILVGLSLAEICSVYPSAGSVYHWYVAKQIIVSLLIDHCNYRSGKLVSPGYAPLASFICGWFNFIGNVAGKN
jgi:amino acid transporter